MAYKGYVFGLIIRLILIFINLLFLSQIISDPNRLFSIIILLGLLILQISELVNHQIKLFRSIESFLSTLEQEDRTIRFTGRLPKSLQSFSDLFHKMIHLIEKKRSENEAQYQLLNELLKNAKVGVFTVSDEHKIQICNPNALQLLGLENFIKLEQIKRSHQELFQKIMECKTEFSSVIDTNNQSLATQISNIILDKNPIKIVSFQDIKNQIEIKEMKAWHQLIRTLGHEILNSVTPISSMTETSLMILENEKKETKSINTLSQNQLEKVKTALNTVNRRSKGLLEFIENYRKLTRIPSPNFERVNMVKFINKLLGLLEKDIESASIKLETDFQSPQIVLSIDKTMLEQVLINLVKNAIQSMENTEEKRLLIKTGNNKDQTFIKITDTGSGIPEEERDKIFIPFYTTKENGTGIGLSLSRQIMQLHGGSIHYNPTPSSGSCFTLTFPGN